MNCYTQRIKSAVCFGLGLLCASLLPSEWVLVIAAGALVVVSNLLCSEVIMKVVLIEKPNSYRQILSKKFTESKKGNQAGIIVICLDTVPKSCYW